MVISEMLTHYYYYYYYYYYIHLITLHKSLKQIV